jgi:hypothetical protein
MKERVLFAPKRKMRQEILALVPVVAAVAAAVAAFPRKAVFAAIREPPRPTAASCAFVTLAPGAEAAAMEDVRSALSVNAASVRNLRTDLSIATIADDSAEPLLDEDSRRSAAPPLAHRYDAVPMPPTAAAPEAAEIPESPDGPAARADAFPRGELLRPGIEPDIEQNIPKGEPQ